MTLTSTLKNLLLLVLLGTPALAQAELVDHPIQKSLSDTSFRIHERTLNKFLSAFETFSGKGEKRIGTKVYNYEWHIENPELKIYPEATHFEGDIYIQIGNTQYQDRVRGTAQLTYQAEDHMIDIEVTSAKFPLKLSVLGQEISLITVDIALFYPIHFYFPSFAQYLQNLPLPQANGTERFDVIVQTPEMALITENIILSSNFDFSKLEDPQETLPELHVPSRSVQPLTPTGSLLQ